MKITKQLLRQIIREQIEEEVMPKGGALSRLEELIPGFGEAYKNAQFGGSYNPAQDALTSIKSKVFKEFLANAGISEEEIKSLLKSI